MVPLFLSETPPVLVNLRGIANVEAWADSPDNVYIGRACRGYGKASPWCNPFKVNATCTRREAIQKFHDYLMQNENLQKGLAKLGNKHLGCWCHPYHATATSSYRLS